MVDGRKRKREDDQQALTAKRGTDRRNLANDGLDYSANLDGVDNLENLSEEGTSSFEGDGSDDEDDDGWTGLNDAAADSNAELAGTVPKKPPTGEELRTIKDAADLYMSSSFKLKIDALLPTVRPKYTRSAPLDKFLHLLHAFLTSLPSVSPQHPLTASRTLLEQGITVPYPNPLPTEDTNWKVAFEKPQAINIVGSWITKLAVKRKDGLPYVVDVAVEMPDSLFQEKDYINNRFFHKKAYYLSVIAASLLSTSSSVLKATKKSKSKRKVKHDENIAEPPSNIDLSWESVRGDPRLTALVLTHKSDESIHDFSGLHVQVRMIPTLSPTSSLSLSKLSPHRSNVRTVQSSSSETSSLAEQPTPIYNSTLLLFTVPRSQLLRTYHLQKTVSAFVDALALLKVWANQRGYGECGTASEKGAQPAMRWTVRGFDGIGAWWTAVLDYLINGGECLGGKKEKRRPLGNSLSSYQLFRAALDFFSRHDWSQQSVFLKPDPESGTRFSAQEYACNGEDAIFVDSTSGVNLLAGVPISSLDMLKHDAKVTLQILGNSNSNGQNGSKDPFDEVFLTDKRCLQSRFDVVIRVDLSKAALPSPSSHTLVEQGSIYNAVLAAITSTLRTGLGNRVKAFAILHPVSLSRRLNEAQISNEPVIHIGLILDAEHAYRLVDYGPPAVADAGNAEDEYTEERKRFKSLWGAKAELRRFKDGRILESVVWEVSTAAERAHIPFLVCKYLLQRHCGLQIEDEEAVAWTGQQWDSLLQVSGDIARMYQVGKAEMGVKAAIAAFDNIVKTLKNMDDDLPLAVLNVSPVSPILRYTNVFNPVAVPPNSPLFASSSNALPDYAKFVPVIDVVIEFEKSARWPDDLRAIQKVKMAFLEAIAAALMAKVKGLKAQVVLEDGDTESIRDTVKLEILTAEGWAFSARIWHDRERTLLDGLIDDKPHIPQAVKKRLRQSETPEQRHDRYTAMVAKEIYLRRYIHGPRHHRAIAALSHRFSAFAGTVRLVKRWLASHWLLDGHVHEEAVELLCARVFLGGDNPSSSGNNDSAKEPDTVPATKERGFALVVEFLKDWEWEGGLFAPLYGAEADDAFENLSGVGLTYTGRRGAWTIKTERDQDGRMWTVDSPDAVVARRIAEIARASWKTLQVVDNSSAAVKPLFVHPTSHYDFIVQIDPTKAPRHFQNVTGGVWQKKGKYANATIASSNEELPVMPGFDPVQMLYDDIKRVYEDSLKIFHDTLGGVTFGAVWDPSIKEARAFRVKAGYNVVPLPKAAEKQKEKDKALVTLNSDAILSEIERMGSGLVTGITVQL